MQMEEDLHSKGRKVRTPQAGTWQETGDSWSEREERVGDIYDSIDAHVTGPTAQHHEPTAQSTKTSETHTAPANPQKKNHLNTAAWCVALLCLLMLSGLAGLAVRYVTVTRQNEELQSALDNKVEDRNLLQSALKNMVEERNHLQSNLENMVEERNLLQSNLDNMVEERNLLQSVLDNMVEERNRLQTAFNTSLKQQDALLKTLHGEGNICMCWQNNICSCYYKSHSLNNWNDSRKACRERGSDLIVVNSKEEQDIVPVGFWLGLTDAEVEGTWKWVDGTPLTTAYWGHPQPDNNGPAPNKEEDCVERYGMGEWNDISCLNNLYWICEKNLDVSALSDLHD